MSDRLKSGRSQNEVVDAVYSRRKQSNPESCFSVRPAGPFFSNLVSDEAYVDAVETAYATGRQTADDRRIVMAFDARTGASIDGQSVNLIENVVCKALAEPSSVPALLTLYGGESYPAVSNPSSLRGQRALSEFPQPTPNLDIARIEQICSINR